MGQRLIITEEEKNRIKLLYEAAPPPSESIVVANKNPFKYDEYKNARKPYSPELKDGDLFYTFDRKLTDEFGKNFIVNFYKPLLINKTIRTDNDKNVTIKDLSAWFYSYVLDKPQINENDSNMFKLYLLYGFGDGSCININTVSKFVENCPDQSGLSFLKGSGTLIENPFHNLIKVNDKLLNFIKSNLPPIIQRSEYPDEYFQVKKIQRQKTDF